MLQIGQSLYCNVVGDLSSQYDDVIDFESAAESGHAQSSGTTASHLREGSRTPPETPSTSPDAAPVRSNSAILDQCDAVSQSTLQSQSGQMLLAAYCNSGLLTVHVMKVRLPLFLTADQQALSAYIKVALLPDETKRTVCKSNTVAALEDCLEIDAKFSYELLEEDIDRRICITAWRSNSKKRNKLPSRFLGGVSFDVRTVCRKKVDLAVPDHRRRFVGTLFYSCGYNERSPTQGWFPLETGAVNSARGVTAGSMSDIREQVTGDTTFTPGRQLPRSLSSANAGSSRTMETRLILIYRGQNGFGFSISGQDPVVVCRVDSGSMAQIAGLALNDRVLRIDGLNVARSNSEHVASLVRKAMHKIVLEVQRPVKNSSNSAHLPHNRQFMQSQNEHQPQPSASGPRYLSHDVQSAQYRRRHRPAEPKQGRLGITDGNGNGSSLQPFVRSESEPLMTSAAELRRPSGSTMPSSFTQQQQQPEWRRSNSLSRTQHAASNDAHCGGKAKDRTDRALTTRINYGWVDPGDDDDDDDEDDDEESDKENRPTFPRSFRPTIGSQSDHLQKSVHHHTRRSAVSADLSPAESLPCLSTGDSFHLATKFDQFSCDDGDEYVDVTRDRLHWRHPHHHHQQQHQHAADFWADDRRSRTRGRLGTIEEVTELSSCSAAALQLHQQSAVDVVSVDGDANNSMTAENPYENNAAFGSSPVFGDAAADVNTSSMETSPSSEGFSSPDVGLQTVACSANKDDDDDEIERQSAASTVDASITFDRPQWCSGVLTFASGKSRFGKVGIVDLYRQRRRQQQRGRREGVEEAVAANSSVDDGADWMSIASGCSSLTDAPPAKRQRLASFKNIIRKGLDKLRRF